MKTKIIKSILSGIIFSGLFFVYTYHNYDQRYLIQGEIKYLDADILNKGINDHLYGLSLVYADKVISQKILLSHENKYFVTSVDTDNRSILFYKIYKFRKTNDSLERKNEDVKRLKLYTYEKQKVLNTNLKELLNEELAVYKKENILYCQHSEFLAYCLSLKERITALNAMLNIKFFYSRKITEKKWTIGPLPLIQGFILGFFLIIFFDLLKRNFKNN